MGIPARPVPPPAAPGFTDALGAREITRTASAGAVETLHIRPELVEVPAFEAAVRDGIVRLSSFSHPSCGRVRRIERIAGSAPGVDVVSDYVEGNRLSEILLIAEHQQIHFTTPAVLDIVQQVVSAIADLHDHLFGGFHGLLGPERIVVGPDARATVVEQVFGQALRRLPRARPAELWTQYRIAAPADSSLPPFGPRSDLVQIGLVALALLHGRLLRAGEYPGRISQLLAAAVETDLIGQRRPVGTELAGWIASMLQVDPERRFKTMAEGRRGLEALLADESRYIAAPIALDALLKPRHHRIRVIRRGSAAESAPEPEPEPILELAPETEPAPPPAPVPQAAPEPLLRLAPESEPVPEPEPVPAPAPVTEREFEPEPNAEPELRLELALAAEGEEPTGTAAETGAASAPEPEPLSGAGLSLVSEPPPEPADAPAFEPAAEPMGESVPEPADAGAERAVPEPVDDAVPEPVDEAVSEPVDEAVPEPADAGAERAVPEPVDDAVPEPVDEAVSEPVDEAVPEPAGDRVTEPADVEPDTVSIPALAVDRWPSAESMPEARAQAGEEPDRETEPQAAIAGPAGAAAATGVGSSEADARPVADLLLEMTEAAPAGRAVAMHELLRASTAVSTEDTASLRGAVLREPEPLPEEITAVHTSAERLLAAAGQNAPPDRPEESAGRTLLAFPGPSPWGNETRMAEAPPHEDDRLPEDDRLDSTRLADSAAALCDGAPIAPRWQPPPQEAPPAPRRPVESASLSDAPGVAAPDEWAAEPTIQLNTMRPASSGGPPAADRSAADGAAADRPVADRSAYERQAIDHPAIDHGAVEARDSAPDAEELPALFEQRRRKSKRAAYERQPRGLPLSEPASTGGRAGLWIGLVAFVLVGALGGGGYWWWQQKLAAQQPGSLEITSRPTGADVTIDGNARGKTPLTLSLRPGRYDVEVRGIGDPRRATVEIESGRSVSQSFTFDIVSLTGALQVLSKQKGVQVTVDGSPRGTAPLTIEELPLGIHTVVLRGPDGETTQDVTIEAAKMSVISTDQTGFLRVQAHLPLQVAEKGQVLGTSTGGPIALSPGVHRLELANPDVAYRGSQLVQVGAGRTATLAVDLPLGMANLDASAPSEVYVDGEKVGDTPVTNLALRLGSHEVLFRSSGRGEVRYDILVTLAAPVRLRVDFKK